MNYSIKNVSSMEELKKTFKLFERIFDGLPVMENPQYSFESWEERMKKHGDLMLYAELDGQVIGIVFGRIIDDESVTIGPVGVHTDFRGNGLAKEMMFTMEDRVKNYGISTINLGAVQSAENFYSKLGYNGGLLIQSQEHTIDQLLLLNKKYKVKFTKTYEGKINQICLEMMDADRELQREYETSLKGCYTQMMYSKDIR